MSSRLGTGFLAPNEASFSRIFSTDLWPTANIIRMTVPQKRLKLGNIPFCVTLWFDGSYQPPLFLILKCAEHYSPLTFKSLYDRLVCLLLDDLPFVHVLVSLLWLGPYHFPASFVSFFRFVKMPKITSTPEAFPRACKYV